MKLGHLEEDEEEKKEGEGNHIIPLPIM